MLKLDIVHRPNQSYLRASQTVKDKIRTLDEIDTGFEAMTIPAKTCHLETDEQKTKCFGDDPFAIRNRNITCAYAVKMGDWINNRPVEASSL